MRFGAFLTALALSCLSGGCGASKLQNNVFDDGTLRFRIGPIPSNWHPVQSEALMAFRNDQAHATVAVNGRCRKDGDDVPLSALTHHLFLAFTERTVIAERQFELDGRAAQRTELMAKLDGVPKSFTVVVLKKDGCVFDFLRIAEVGSSQSTSDFDRFVEGFATLNAP